MRKKPKPKAKVEPKSPPKEASADDDDPEEDIDGEKIRRSKLREAYKRQKDFERASHQRMREAAEARKSVETKEQELLRVANALRAREQGLDPFAIHRAAGATDDEIDSIAEQRLIQRMKRAQMTPEQIEAEQNAFRLQQLEQENAQFKQRETEQKQGELRQKWVKHFDEQIGQALETGNLARNADTAREVADVMLEYYHAGQQITPDLAASIVQDNQDTKTRHRFTWVRDQLKASRISDERALALVGDLIGPDLVKFIQTSAVKKAQNFEPQKPKVAPQQTPTPKKHFDSYEEAEAWIAQQKKVKHG